MADIQEHLVAERFLGIEIQKTRGIAGCRAVALGAGVAGGGRTCRLTLELLLAHLAVGGHQREVLRLTGSNCGRVRGGSSFSGGIRTNLVICRDKHATPMRLPLAVSSVAMAEATFAHAGVALETVAVNRC